MRLGIKKLKGVIWFAVLAGWVMMPGPQWRASALTAPAIPQRTFVMAVNRSKEAQVYKFWELIYTEVFRRIGVAVTLESYPMKRAGVEVARGRADGEPARIYAYADAHPNLIRVEESVYPITVTAFTADPSIPRLTGWESLRGKSYRVEYVLGMKISADNLGRIVKKETLSPIPTTLQGLYKLVSNRTDVFIDDDIVVAALLAEKEAEFNRIRAAGVMETVPLYMVVHKKNKGLVKKLARAIKAVKSEGLIRAYQAEVFGVSR